MGNLNNRFPFSLFPFLSFSFLYISFSHSRFLSLLSDISISLPSPLRPNESLPLFLPYLPRSLEIERDHELAADPLSPDQRRPVNSRASKLQIDQIGKRDEQFRRSRVRMRDLVRNLTFSPLFSIFLHLRLKP